MSFSLVVFFIFALFSIYAQDETKVIIFGGTNYEPAFDKETKFQFKFDSSDKDRLHFSVLFETPYGSEFFPIMQITGVRIDK